MSDVSDNSRPTSDDLERLATYNAEVARGLTHTPAWQWDMAQIQRRFNLHRDEWAGYHISPPHPLTGVRRITHRWRTP